MSVVQRIAHLAAYIPLRALFMVAQALPHRAAMRLGEELGGMAGLFMPRRRRIGMRNLMKSYPEMSSEEAETTILNVFRHFGRAAAECSLAPRLLRPTTYRDRMVIRGEENLQRVVAEGKGAIVVTAHLGVWEIFGLVLRYLGARPHIVYKRMRNPYAERFVHKWRSDFGQIMLPHRGAIRALARVLRDGGCAALLVDQHTRRHGVWVPFFGRPASTTPAPAALALMTGAPILMGYGVRLPGAYRFELFLDEPIYAESTGDREGDIRRITARIARRIEDFVRLHPEQWLWIHRRWHQPHPERGRRERMSKEPGHV